MLTRNDDWLAENEIETDTEYEQVWVASSDTTLSQEQASEIFSCHSAYVVVEGSLKVEGHLAVEEASYLECGDIHCHSFWVGEGVVDIDAINARDYVEFACHPSDMHESFVKQIVTPLLVTMDEDGMDEVCENVQAEFALAEVEESGKLFPWILLDNPGEIVAALRKGETIDEAWLIAHKHLVTNEERKKHVQ